MSGRASKLTVWLGALGLLCITGLGVGLAVRNGWIERVYVYREGAELRRLSGSTALRSVSWSEPREVPGGRAAEGATLPPPSWQSPSIVLVAARGPNGDFDIGYRELTDAGWSAFVPLPGAANSPHDDVTPRLIRGGSALCFASNRPGGLGGFDLYASRRGPDGWEAPVTLGSGVNSPYDETGPAMHPAGALLVFSTNRPRSFVLSPPLEWADVPLASWKATGAELVSAVPRGSPEDRRWSDVQPLEPLSSPAEDREPCFSPSGELLYFSSARAGGLGGFDLYRARCRLDGDPASGAPSLLVEAPENAGRPLNSVHDDGDPGLFLDGFAILYRAVDRGRGVEGLLESRTREVTSEIEIATIPLGTLARNLGRLAILLAAGALFAALVIAILRYRRFWALSLVLRCAAIALLIHIGMLYGFYFWVVSDKIVALARRAPVEEVAVEKMLEAKLAVETMRMEIAAPEKEPPRPVLERTERRPPEISKDAEPARETVVLATAVSPAATPLETAAEARIHPRETEDGPALEAIAPPPLPGPAPAALSVPEPTAAAEPAGAAARALASLKAAVDAPRPGPVSAVEERAPSAETPPPQTAIQAAATQVHALTHEALLLPPIARPSVEPPPAVTALEVPAQASDPSPDRAAEAPQAPARPLAGRLSPPSEASSPPEVRTTVATTAESPWRSEAAGILSVPRDLADAREIPRALLPPAEEPRDIPAASTRLPEVAPVAHAASRAEEGTVTPAARPTERIASLSAPIAGVLRAEILSVEARAESRPLAAPSDSVAPALAASPARLDARPAPGATLEALLPRVEPVVARSVALLPEGEAGVTPARGSPETADIIPKPRPSVRAARAAFAAAQDAPAPAAGPELARLEPASAPGLRALPQSPPAVSGRLTPPSPSPEAPPPCPEPVTVAALRVAPRLAEVPPEIRREKDLGKVRSSESRRILVSQMGGTKESEDAVHRALEWLARHQSRDGRWDVDGFDADCHGCRSPGIQVSCDAAVTGLALLCFLGQNHTPGNPASPFRRPVGAAIDWLLSIQARDGCLAGDDDRYVMYSHGIATLALSEAYILTRDERLEEPVRRAAHLIVSAQNKKTGGWRYKTTPPLRGDTSITGWQVLALVSARGAGMDVPEGVFDRARHWLDVEAAGGQHRGIWGYTKPEEPRVAMTAEGMYARLLLGARRDDRNIDEAARYIHTETRGGGHLDNLYLLYYGNLALYHYQGWIWERWNEDVREFLVRSQQRSGTLSGSWDPTGQWTETGGRVLSTCFATLTLEVYYRYLPLYWTLDREEKANR